MTFLSRTMIAATAGLVLLGTASCAGEGLIGGGGEQKPPKSTEVSNGLKDLNVCEFFTPEDLEFAQVSPPGEKFGTSFEPGCTFEGEDRSVSLLKNEEETVASYEDSGNFDSFEPTKVNGRSGAEAVSAGSAGQGYCSVMVDAGDGVALVTVQGRMRDSVPDTCGEAKKIATKIEPRLPK